MSLERIASTEDLIEHLPEAALFDVDGTLGEGYEVEPEIDTLEMVREVGSYIPIGIVSAGEFERIKKFILERMPNPGYRPMVVFSENGGRCHIWNIDGGWKEMEEYKAPPLTPDEKRMLSDTIRATVPEVVSVSKIKWDVYDDRATSVAWAAREEVTSDGRTVPVNKETWDHDGSKRALLIHALKEKLPSEYRIVAPGRVTVTISKRSKADAVNIFAKILQEEWGLNISPSSTEMVGDRFEKGGADADTLVTGVQGRKTTGPQNTRDFMERLRKAFVKKAQEYPRLE